MQAMRHNEMRTFGLNTVLTAATTMWLVALGVTSEVRYRAAVYEHAVVLPLPPASTRQCALRQMEKNLNVYRTQAAIAKQQGAQLIVFPEDGLYGMLLSRDQIRPFLETVPDPRVRSVNPCLEGLPHTEVQTALSCLARDVGIYLVANMGDRQPCNASSNSTCPSDGQWQFNTAVAFGPDGQLLARYHKINLYGEPQFDTPPPDTYNSAVTFNTSFGVRFGLAICFDLLFRSPPVDLVERWVFRVGLWGREDKAVVHGVPRVALHAWRARSGLSHCLDGRLATSTCSWLPLGLRPGPGGDGAGGKLAPALGQDARQRRLHGQRRRSGIYYDSELLSPGSLVIADVLQDGTARMVFPGGRSGSGRDLPSRKPDFVGVQPDSLSAQPGLLDKQPDFVGVQPDFPGRQPDFVGVQPDSLSAQPDLSDRQPDSLSAQPGLSDKQPDFVGVQPDFPGRQPDFVGVQPDSLSAQPDLSDRQPDSLSAQPDLSDRQPDSLSAQPDLSTRHPVFPGRQPDPPERQTGHSYKESHYIPRTWLVTGPLERVDQAGEINGLEVSLQSKFVRKQNSVSRETLITKFFREGSFANSNNPTSLKYVRQRDLQDPSLAQKVILETKKATRKKLIYHVERNTPRQELNAGRQRTWKTAYLHRFVPFMKSKMKPVFLSDNFTFVPLNSTLGQRELCFQEFCCSVEYRFAGTANKTPVSDLTPSATVHRVSRGRKPLSLSEESSMEGHTLKRSSILWWRTMSAKDKHIGLERENLKSADNMNFDPISHDPSDIRSRNPSDLEAGEEASELYALGVFSGFEGDLGTQRFVQVCLVTRCPGGKLDSCGQPVTTATSRMAALRLQGHFSARHVFPEVLTLQGGQLSPAPGLWDYASGAIVGRTQLSESPLVAAALYGRWYDRDHPPVP